MVTARIDIQGRLPALGRSVRTFACGAAMLALAAAAFPAPAAHAGHMCAARASTALAGHCPTGQRDSISGRLQDS